MNRRVLVAVCIIPLGLVMLIVAMYDMVNENGWMLQVLFVDVVLLIPLVWMLLGVRKTAKSPTDKAPASAVHLYRCPSCKKTFSLSVRTKKPTSFTHTCPQCGYMGTITVAARK